MYKLQVNDELFIGITSNDESLVQIFSSQTSKDSYFSNYPIDDLGLIRIPNLGPINVLGYTTREVRKIIENELEKFIKKTLQNHLFPFFRLFLLTFFLFLFASLLFENDFDKLLLFV